MDYARGCRGLQIAEHMDIVQAAGCIVVGARSRGAIGVGRDEVT